MSKTLLVTASPSKSDVSNSRKVASHFVDCLRKESQQTLSLTHLDLYNEHPIDLSVTTLGAMAKVKAGQKLCFEEEDTLKEFYKHVSLFQEHRYIIIASPLWNFGVPPRLKAYIDAIVIPGKTFRYTDKGPEGLLSGKGMRLAYIQASGSLASQPPMGVQPDHNMVMQQKGAIAFSAIDSNFLVVPSRYR